MFRIIGIKHNYTDIKHNYRHYFIKYVNVFQEKKFFLILFVSKECLLVANTMALGALAYDYFLT